MIRDGCSHRSKIVSLRILLLILKFMDHTPAVVRHSVNPLLVVHGNIPIEREAGYADTLDVVFLETR